MPKNYVKILSL